MRMITHRRKVLAGQIVVVLATMVTIEAIPRAGLLDPFTMIPLSEMVGGLRDMAQTGPFWHHVWVSLSAMLVSFALALVLGIAIGYLLWSRNALRKVINPYLVSFYAVPVFLFYPALSIMLNGSGFLVTLCIATSWAMVAIILATIQGLEGLPKILGSVVRVYGLSERQTIVQVRLRAAVPHLAGGIELAVSYAVLGVLSAEFLLAPQGLGYLIRNSYNNFDVRSMWGATLAVVVIVLVLAALTRRVVRRLQWPTD